MSRKSFVLPIVYGVLLGMLLPGSPKVGRSAVSEPSPCQQAETCFQNALDALIKGEGLEPTDAHVTRLHGIQERFPGTISARRAGLVIGLLMLDDDPARSRQFFRTALRDFPFLEDYIRYWLAQTEARLGRHDRAARLFEAILDAFPNSVLRPEVLFQASQTWARSGSCDQAQARFGEAVVLAPDDPQAPAANLALAECQRQLGRIEAASATMRRLWITYPTAPETEEVDRWQAEGVLTPPTPEVRYRRALRLVEEALYPEAILELERFLGEAPPEAPRTDAIFELAYALARMKRYDQARPLFQELAAQESVGGDALVWLGRIYLRQGEGEQLARIVEDPFPASLSAAQKAKLLVFWGVWLEDHGKNDDAVIQYRRILDEVDRASREAAEALWRIGWIHYREARFQDAEAAFRRILDLDPHGDLAPRALYWTARTLDRLGQRGEAESVYDRLEREHPWTYYAQLSRGKRPGLHAENRFGTNGAGSSGGQVTTRWWGRDVHYRKAMELMRIGQDQAAAAELERLVQVYTHDTDALLELSVLLADAGSFHAALRLGRLYLDRSENNGNGLDTVPPEAWQMTYPTGYVEAIPDRAQGRVDPCLVAAIIREESHYNPRAVSRAGALGLMQLMPATARVMAAQLGAGEVSREALFDHQTNIRFGTWYLVSLLERFEGNIVYAVAAYNAGPRAVTRWNAEFGGRAADEFVELIPYRETRRYVKRVLYSYRAYRRIQPELCPASSLDTAS